MDKFLRLKIKTKLTFGIGLLFTMIVLLGGLAVQNITDMSSDTQNILADNYNSLLYSRRMLDALERIKNDPQARAEFEKNLDLQQKNITEIDENVATAHLVAQYEAMHRDLNDTTIQRVRMALNDIMSLNMATIYRKSKVAERTADQALLWICIIAVACVLIAFAFLIRLPRSITSPIRKLTDGVFSASADELTKKARLRPELARAILQKKAFADAEREVKHCRKHGIEIIASTDAQYPALLRETADYPHVLYVLGSPKALGKTTLTMVGTRRMTPYGQQMADRLIGELADRVPDTVIVSGLAFGIDTACHRAALAFGMPTVGIIASALPGITPAQHTAVARDMIEHGGAVVSELHSQTRQNGNFYHSRNRLLAGISGGTVVVESPAEGGSMDTARLADGYNRTLMAVPGRATDFASAGTNLLIRTQRAQMVCTGEDIVREMMWDQNRPGDLIDRPTAAPAALTRDEEGLLGCFRTDDPISAEELCELSGLGFGELSALLLGLEMAGAVRQLPGNRYMKLR